MSADARPIIWFEDLRKSDTSLAGGKGANLGELAHADLPVPPGFVVTADAYLDAMGMAGYRGELERLAAATDPDVPAALSAAAHALRGFVHKAGVPPALRRAIVDAYRKLGPRANV